MKKISQHQKTRPTILALGDFEPQDILITKIPANRKINHLLESEIEKIWEQNLKQANLENRTIYNENCYRLEKAELRERERERRNQS